MSGAAAAVLIWQDVAPEGQAEYHRWQTREHAPSRLACPGFTRARRHRADPAHASTGAPEFFVLYEADSPQALVSPEYLELLGRPTPWSVEIVRSGVITNFVRASSVLATGRGSGTGAFVGTLDFSAPGTLGVDVLGPLLDEVVEQTFVVGVRLYVADQEAIAARDATTEGTWGDGTTRVARTTVLVEAATAEAAAAATASLRQAVADAGSSDGMWSGVYQLTNIVETPAATPFTEVARD